MRVLMVLVFAVPLQAQSIADRIQTVREGAVSFHFAARPGVCGDGEHFIRTGRSSYHGSFSSDRRMEPCIAGPVQVRLTLEDGEVSRVQSWVGPLRSRQARDIGVVSAPEAARYLVTIAARGRAGASTKAIFPAVLADSATVWPALLAIARDSDTRSRADHRSGPARRAPDSGRGGSGWNARSRATVGCLLLAEAGREQRPRAS